MIEHFIQSFGDITVGQAVIVISAIVFLVMVYKKVTSYISKKALDEKEKNDRIQEVIDQAKQYPVWRQQSVDIREKSQYELIQQPGQKDRQIAMLIRPRHGLYMAV